MKQFEVMLRQLENSASNLYQGYIDDPRNTDNAWMETACCHYHCDDVEGLNEVLDALNETEISNVISPARKKLREPSRPARLSRAEGAINNPRRGY